MEIVIKVLCVIAGMLIVWFCVELYRKYQASVISKKYAEEDDFIWGFEQDIADALAERDFWEVKPKKKVAKKAVKKITKKETKKKTKK
jgi:hypothetical protein